ncbi:hypothetical protein QBC45DRAFT_331356 [Copromyces sp. CBS 386.78]|nr:hypothetical protein QBC45DRAFT_331356 [Copromyces sp. CBS 386.78]
MDASQSQPQSQSGSQPLFYSPALPSELLWYILHHCSHPTTLIVCSSRLEFLTALARDIKRSQEDEKPQGRQQEQQQQQQAQGQGEKKTSLQAEQDEHIHSDTAKNDREEAQEPQSQPPQPSQQQSSGKAQSIPAEPAKATKITSNPWASQLLASPLYQIAVARHIRTVFIPTVSHLRAFLSVFETNTSTSNKVSAPPSTYDSPPNQSHPQPRPQQQLLVYGFLSLHRDSSEWSVQGLNNSVAVLLEAGRRVGLAVGVVEPVEPVVDHEAGVVKGMDGSLGEKMPVVNGSALRGVGARDLLERSVAGKTVDVRRVLGRWFRFGVGEWERERERERKKRDSLRR